MRNKKTLLLIIGLVVVSAVGTWYLRNYQRLGNWGARMMIQNTMQPVAQPPLQMVGEGMGSAGVAKDTMMQVYPTEPGIPYPYYPDDALDVDERLYQKSSYHEVIVDNVSQYAQQLREYFLSIEGRVLSSSVNSGEDYQQAYMVVKVPVEKFEEATGRVTQNVEKIVTESVTAQDETGRMVNATSTLEKLQEQKSLKEIELLEATTEVERRRIQLEIDRLDRQIEQAEQNLNSAENQIEYATLSITASDNERFFNPYGELTIREELERAWESLKGTARLVLSLLVWVVVYAVIWVPLVMAVRWLRNRMKTDQSGKTS